MFNFITHNSITNRLRTRARAFVENEEGGMAIFGLFIFATMATVGAVGLDVAHLITARTQLQVAADLVAHAAIYNRDTMNAVDAKQAALRIVYAGMPTNQYGSVLSTQDITFGTYDPDTGVFTESALSRSAVQVSTERAATSDNPVASMLFQFVGIDDWDVRASAVFTTFRPMCFREGFVADGVVDLQSNNGYSNGFCIHSNEYVSMNSNNSFEAGTVVSMPNTADLDLPQSGFQTNLGLQAALRSGTYRMRILNRIDRLIAEIGTYGSASMPSYITSSTIERRTGSRFNATNFVPGRIHRITCSGARVTIEAGTILRNVVVIVPCEIRLGSGVILEDVVMVSTATGANSISSPSGLQVGRDDNCAVGGGAQIVTKGGMSFPADLRMFGGQLIALGDISFAANANGIEGASMVAGGQISGTSNMAMGFCGAGMEGNFEAEYFRLAR